MMPDNTRAKVRRMAAYWPFEPVRVGSRRVAFEGRRLARNVRYRGERSSRGPASEAGQTLDRDGIVVLPGRRPAATVESLLGEFELCLGSAALVIPPYDDVHRAAHGDDRPGGPTLDLADIEAGPDHYRTLTNNVAVAQPLVSCPTALELAFDTDTLELTGEYLRCPAAIGGIDLRRSFVNDIPGVGDLYKFHSDANAFRMLKVFTYLKDVDEDGGPLLYVRGSHRRRFPGWTGKYLWSRDEMVQHFGADRLLAMTGHAGDVIVADTSGFHTGLKPHKRDRSVLIVNYIVHEELDGRHPWLHMPAQAVENLSPIQRAATDLLRIDTGISVES